MNNKDKLGISLQGLTTIKNKIEKQTMLEHYLNNISPTKEAEPFLQGAVNTEVEQWENIVEELEEYFPFLNKHIFLNDLLLSFLDSIPNIPCDSATGKMDYIRGAAELISESFLYFCTNLDDLIAFYESTPEPEDVF